MSNMNENLSPELQKYEGKGVTLPVGLWECMAQAYFADSKVKYKTGGSGGEMISVSEGIFWKVARAYYGDGFSYRQESGTSVPDTGGVDLDSSTEVKIYKPVPGPTAIPRGNLARIAAHGIQSDTDEGTKGSSTDDSGPHQS